MRPPGPCVDCGHEEFPYPPCECRKDGCWCAASAVLPLDLPLPPHVLRGQRALVDLDDLDGEEAS